MTTFYHILGPTLAEKEAKEEEERRKAMSAKLSGLTKKERIKLLLQKNNMNIDEPATENTTENGKTASNIFASSVEKIDPAADDKTSVKDSKVSSLVMAYDSDASNDEDGEETAHEAKKEVALSGSVGQDKLYEMVVSVDMKKELTSDALAEMEALFEEANKLPGFEKAKEEIADKREIGNDREKPDKEMVHVKEGTSKALKDALSCAQPTTSEVVEDKQTAIDRGKKIMENVAEYDDDYDDSLVETSKCELEENAEESEKDDKERPNVETAREDKLQGEMETDEKVDMEGSMVSVSAEVTDTKSITDQSTGESSIEIEARKEVTHDDVDDVVAEKESTRDDVKIKDLKFEDKKPPKEAVDLETQKQKEFSVDMFAEESDHEVEELKKGGSELEAGSKKDVPRSASKEDKSDKERKVQEEKVGSDTKVKDQSSKSFEKSKGKVSSKESSKDGSKGSSKEKSSKDKVSKDSASKVKDKGTDEGKKSKHKEKKKDKEKNKEKKKDKKRKSEHKNEDKKHKDSDKKHKDGDRKRKEDKDDRSSRKKHSEKDRSSEKSSRKSKEEVKTRKKEEELLTEKEKLRREEERRKVIQEEIKREERLRSEYERSKKEERERREEEQRKKEIEEKKLEEKKKEEELKKEEEIHDFAAMLLEGKYEDFILHAAKTYEIQIF